MIVHETKRLLLRTWHHRDLEKFSKINQDPKTMAYYPSIMNESQTEKVMDIFTKHYKEHGFTFYAAELKATNSLIGYMGLLHVDIDAHFTPAVEIGCRLYSEHWGKGLAVEGLMPVIQNAFKAANINEIIAMVQCQNKKSFHVMKKFGMIYDRKDDFDHPGLTKNHPLKRFSLFRLTKEKFLEKNDSSLYHE